jgi:hypothetical protein
MRTLDFLFFFAAIALTTKLHAQETISTDRPGITFSPTVIGPGVFQIEAGLPQYAAFRGNGVDDELWSIPVQLRYGLTPSVELRLAGTPWNRFHDDTTGDSVDGPGDIDIGTKIALTGDDADIRTAAILDLRLPVGDDDFTTHQAGYALNFAASTNVDANDYFTGLLGITRTPIADENAVTGSLALLYGHAFEDTPLGAYVEAGWFPDIDNSVDTAVAGAGVTYVVNKDLQLDAFGDFGLNEDTPDAVVGFGISWRL